MKHIIKSLTIIFFLSISFYPQEKKSFFSVFDSISDLNIKKHLEILAHDSLEGRAVGTKGSVIASKYISDRFADYKLKKISKGNSYFQNIPMHGSKPLGSSELIFIFDKDSMHLNLAEDYFLYRSGQQTFMPTFLPLVFVGYGIVAPEFDYNDYQSVDVEGKIVVYIDGEPYSEDEHFFNGTLPTIYSNPESKRRIAFARGCAGTIQIPITSYKSWDDVYNDFQFEDVTLAYTVSGNINIIINPDEAYKLFYGSGYSFDDVLDMYVNNRISSFQLKPKMRFRGAFKERDFVSPNVIGMIEGSDPELKDNYLIISAHYDHLGIGESVRGDSIFNGALDNAIGVSVMLELAKSFSDLTIKPKRSIIFIATTGEEKGLLGSIYYTDNPVVPLYKTIANVNIDGIAMFKDFKSIVGIGAEYSTLEKFLFESANKYDLEVQDIPSQFKKVGAFNNSDQLAFAKAGIPSILILEGTKNASRSEEDVINGFIDYFENRYHSPQDDLMQSIDFKAAEKHTKILFEYCYSLANSSSVPEWKSGSPFINSRLQSIAEKK